jgi:DNA-binding NtrC family response regulator
MNSTDIGILIVNPNDKTQSFIEHIKAKFKDSKVYCADTIRSMQKLLKHEHVDILLVNENRQKPIKVLAETIKRPHTETVIMPLINSVQEVLENDGFDYVLKGDISELIVPLMLKKYAGQQCKHRKLSSQIHIYSITDMTVPGMVGKSPKMQALAGMIWRVSQSDRPVLITGPSGSGKELVANAIHRLGPTPDQRFLDINCGAIPENLIEAQLFGYERGAFTGAERRHEGYFHLANQGTLFLDEIAELPMLMQTKLLRVLESRTFRRLGCNEDCTFAGRVIAATHVDLEQQVRHNAFREDLFFRLNVLVLRVAPLSERRSDIPLLIEHFAKNQPRPLAFTENAVSTLANRDWPGNVRELRNTIDRIAVLSDDDPITDKTISDILLADINSVTAKLEAHANSILNLDVDDKLNAIQNALVSCALDTCEGNKSAAARLLGVHRKVIERRLNGTDLTQGIFDADNLCNNQKLIGEEPIHSDCQQELQMLQ